MRCRAGEDPHLAHLHLAEEAVRRGISPEQEGPMPSCIKAAAHWLTTLVARQGSTFSCCYCARSGRDMLLCHECDSACCQPCLGLAANSLFNVGFTCVACLTLTPAFDLASPDAHLSLGALMAGQLVTLSQALKPATWAGYQRCLAVMEAFMLRHRIVIFPILNHSTAHSFTLFLQHLKDSGKSWSCIRHYRSTVKAVMRCLPGISAEASDPFKRFPILERMWAGVHRSVSTVVKPRRPMPGGVAVSIILFLWNSFLALRFSSLRRARTALRNALIWAYGFFGIRRSAELFANAQRTMGLLLPHVSLVRGVRVQLFIQSMKNDTYAQGHTVWMAWITSSGVPIGEMTETYLSVLQADGVAPGSPFFAPTAADGLFHTVREGSVSRFNGVVKDTLRDYFVDLSEDLLREYSFHSLRRGGATWARSRGVPLGLILAQGLWTTVEGARTYIVPPDEERILSSSLM